MNSISFLRKQINLPFRQNRSNQTAHSVQSDLDLDLICPQKANISSLTA